MRLLPFSLYYPPLLKKMGISLFTPILCLSPPKTRKTKETKEKQD